MQLQTFEQLKEKATGKCVNRPWVQRYFRVEEPMQFQQFSAMATAEPGDYVVLSDAFAWLVPAEEFPKHYDVINGRNEA